MPLMANSQVEIYVNGIYYSLWPETKNAQVVKNLYHDYSGSLEILSVVIYNEEEYKVTSIGSLAFSECDGLTSVTIPNSVTSIGYKAFYYCSGLTSVTIPNSVTSMGDWAFSGCSGLTSVTISNSVTSIGECAFSGCSGLTSVTIPNSVTSIGDWAFSGCSGLTSVTIPNSVTSIGGNAFGVCVGLTSVTIPNSVTSIGNGAFGGCGLTSVTIPNSVTSIENNTFYQCKDLTSVTIPNSVTSIGDMAFAYCNVLLSVTIPNSVTSIGYWAFNGCPHIASIVIESGNSVYDSRGGCNAIIRTNDNTLITGCKNTIIPNSVTSIGDAAFWGCNGLTSVTIPNSVTSIGQSAFSDCIALTSVTIPNSVMSIGQSAFYHCSRLTSVTIGSGIRNIGKSAFADCNILEYVYCYAETVPSTKVDAFDGSYIGNATLYVPEVSVNAYSLAEPWKSFRVIVGMKDTNPSAEKCSVPTISYENGKLKFSCSTEGATFAYEIQDEDVKMGYADEVQLTATYHISVYAIKSGYNDSDVATATLCWIDKEPTITTDVMQIPSQAVLIQSEGGILTVRGIDDGTQVSIYGIDGTEAGSAIGRNGEALIGTNLKPGSVAIVKIGKKSVKVITR